MSGATPGWTRLRSFIRENVTFADTPPAERAAFDAYAIDRTHRGAVLICAVVIVADLVAWPLDRVIFPEQALQRQIAPIWRSLVLGIALLFALLNWWPPRWLRGSALAITVQAMILSAIPAYGLALSGGIEQPSFGTLYFTCFATLPMLFPFLVRVGSTTAIVAATLAAFFGCEPKHLQHPLIGTAFGCATTLLLGAIGIGQALYSLSRRSFLQERALEERARALAALDQAKSDFFANVSHELRTPLTLILGSFRRLSRESREPAALAAVEPGLRNAAQLLRLINDLLELARHDAGRGAPERREVDLALLVRRVAANFAPAGSGLVVNGAEQPLPIAVDPRQVRMALDNLLANAVKFTDPATRRIEVTLTEQPDSVRLQVTDNGVGIEPELLPTIFDRFVQGTAGSTRRFAGTGIGLSIVREVVRGHGGTVDVASEPGRGSTFTLTLPRPDGLFPPADLDAFLEQETAIIEAPPSPPLPQDRPGARVLIVDDNADLRAYLVSLLEPHYAVAEARDGAHALEVAAAFNPELVVTDFMMPEVDGAMLLRRLREAHPRTSLPVLFLTARAGTEARAELLELGADDYLTKPFDERELLARVQNLLAGRQEAQELVERNATLERVAAERAAALLTLARRIDEVQESERLRIAGDLHDELGQLLTSARIEAELAARRRDPTGLDRLVQRLDEALSATRSVVRSLRPLAVAELGFTGGLRSLLEKFAERGRVDCGWNIEVDDGQVPPAVAGTAFRLVQEALTNIERHSQAQNAFVEVTEDAGWLRIVVEDDGAGFDPAQVDTTQHSGLVGMRERVARHDGTLDVQRLPAGGMRVDARLPLAPPAQERVA